MLLVGDLGRFLRMLGGGRRGGWRGGGDRGRRRRRRTRDGETHEVEDEAGWDWVKGARGAGT